MVRRLLAYGLLTGLFCLLVAVAAGGWLAGTTAGSRTWVGWVTAAAPGIAVEQVEGNLLTGLRLQGVRAAWPGAEVAVESLRVRWYPAALFFGEWRLSELLANGVTLTPTPPAQLPPPGPEAPPPGHWPQLRGWPLRLAAGIDRLVLRQVKVVRAGTAPLLVPSLKAELSWRQGLLAVTGLQVELDQGRVFGDLGLGLGRPALQVGLQSQLNEVAGGIDRLRLTTALEGSADGAGVAGPLTLTANLGPVVKADLRARVFWAPGVVRFTELQVTSPGRSGVVTGNGRLEISADSPQLQLTLGFSDLDLQPEVGRATALTGELRLAGSWHHYQGSLSCRNVGEAWETGQLTGDLQGSPQSLVFGQLRGTWLGGSFDGQAEVDWGQGLTLAGTLAVRRLNPALISPQIKGQLSFDLDGSWRQESGEVGEAQLHGRLLSSRLAGRALSGEADLTLRGADLTLTKLELVGDGLVVKGRGRLAERLDLVFRAERLEGLLPGVHGSVAGQGWLRFAQGRWTGTLSATAEDLSMAGLSAATLSLSGRIDEAGLAVGNLDGESWQWRGVTVDQVHFQGNGRLADHRLRLELAAGEGRLLLEAAGAWRAGRWTGQVERLQGRDPMGPWHLAQPFDMDLTATTIAFAPFRLQGAGEEFMQLSGQAGWEPLTLHLAGRWQDLNLTRANPWLAGATLQGDSKGSFAFNLAPGGLVELNMSLAVAATVTPEGEPPIRWEGEALGQAGESGMQLHGRIGLGVGGEMQVEFDSKEALRRGLPVTGALEAQWQQLNLALIDPWLPQVELAGHSSGQVRSRWSGTEGVTGDGQITVTGRVGWAGQDWTLSQSSLNFAADAKSLSAQVEVQLAEGGSLKAEVNSQRPQRMEIPQRGHLTLSWEQIALAGLLPGLPASLTLSGGCSGAVSGSWAPGWRLDLVGESLVSDGLLTWKEPAGQVTVPLQTAVISGVWREQRLRGKVDLVLSDYGKVAGEVDLPLPAGLPIAFDPAADMHATLQAHLREHGLLSAFFPGLVQESRGQLTLDATLDGSWQHPLLGGTVALAGAGGYVPTAGIHLKEASLQARLEGETITIENWAVDSGEGRLQGSGQLRLENWHLRDYQGQLQGDQVQLVNLPELQAVGSPDLQFEGTPRRLKVRGKLRLPAVLVQGRQSPPPQRESGDVILIDQPATAVAESPLVLDVQVQVILGDHVLVKMVGVDARLEGDVTVSVTGLTPEQITGAGKISVAEGSYAAYGMNLQIERGTLLFAGGAIDQPTLDVLALRSMGTVKAGVRVGGTPRTLQVTLYSEPPMPDTDVLSYIVFGQPLGSDRSQASALTTAAGILLARGESAVLQDTLRRRLGVDVFQVSSTSGEVESSVLTIGKYLRPDLYISIGHSLFSGADQLFLRYSLNENWEVESTMGQESGADLYYKIEFD